MPDCQQEFVFAPVINAHCCAVFSRRRFEGRPETPVTKKADLKKKTKAS